VVERPQSQVMARASKGFSLDLQFPSIGAIAIVFASFCGGSFAAPIFASRLEASVTSVHGFAGSQQPMKEFSTVELLRDLKTVRRAAAHEPVAITQHRKPRFVLMALEVCERVKSATAVSRRVYRVEETPPELAALLSAGLGRLIDGKDEVGGT